MQCPLCPKTERMQRFAHHLKNHHALELAQTMSDQLAEAIESDDEFITLYGVFCCMACGVAWKSRSKAEEHGHACAETHRKECKRIYDLAPQQKQPIQRRRKFKMPPLEPDVIHASIIVSDKPPLVISKVRHIKLTPYIDGIHVIDKETNKLYIWETPGKTLPIFQNKKGYADGTVIDCDCDSDDY